MQSISLQEAEQLYLKLPERSNDKHVMLVMYAPWCSHCKAMETQVTQILACCTMRVLKCSHQYSPVSASLAHDHIPGPIAGGRPCI